MTKRVVITGMGAVTPIGLTVSQSWEALKAGTNGIDQITGMDITDQKCTMGAEIKDFEFPILVLPREWIDLPSLPS